MNKFDRDPTGYQLPVFAAYHPSDGECTSPRHHSVIIVGGGLTGLTLAVDLKQRGIDAIVLDEDNTVGVRGASSRGMVYVQKTLEIMARLGIYHRMCEKGITWSRGRTFSGEDEIYSFDRAADNHSYQPAFINLQQFYVEWFLVDRLTELGAPPRWHNKVVALEQDAGHPRVLIDAPNGEYSLICDYLIDASGANSQLRQMLGVKLEADLSIDRWCICDARFHRDVVPERWTWVNAPFNENRAVWQHVMADNVWRLDYQLAPESDPAAAGDFATAEARVRAHLGPDIPFEIIWVGPWQYRTQLVDNFRYGNVFMIGDAAHVMSPFGARGGNSGIHDADNLGWKLALVIKNAAAEHLLDSYNQERRAAAIENIEITRRTSRFLAPESDFEFRLRQAAIDLARRHEFAQALINTGRFALPNIYATSPLHGKGGGSSLPNLPLRLAGTETSLLDVVAATPGLTALAVETEPGKLDDLKAAFATAPIAVCAISAADDITGDIFRLTKAKTGSVMLIRPDLYLAALVPIENIFAEVAKIASTI